MLKKKLVFVKRNLINIDLEIIRNIQLHRDLENQISCYGKTLANSAIQIGLALYHQLFKTEILVRFSSHFKT